MRGGALKQRGESVLRSLLLIIPLGAWAGCSYVEISPAVPPNNTEPVYELTGPPPGTGERPGAMGKPLVDPEDLIESGDTLGVVVRRGAGEEKYDATVRANGNISVSFMEINVKGLSEAEAEARLAEKLSAVIREPRVQVRLLQKGITRPKNFYALGEVKTPGKFPLGRRLTLLQALSTAGGHSDVADLTKVVVISKRGEAPLIRVANLQMTLVSGDTRADLQLEDNDVMFVPRSAIGDWSVYYQKALLPVMNTIFTTLNAVFIGKTLQVLLATPDPGGAQATIPVCWVASTLYGEHAWQTHLLRWYILGPFSEHWHGRLFANLYSRYGQWVAQVLQRHPSLQGIVRPLFDRLLRQAVSAAGQERHGEGATRRRGDPPVSASPRPRVPVSS